MFIELLYYVHSFDIIQNEPEKSFYSRKSLENIDFDEKK